MSVLRQFDKIIIKDYITDVFLYEPHGHTYYEMIYIYQGKGNHLLNYNKMLYGSGDLFLISPGDHHHFEVEEPTRFIVIKFTEEYFRNEHLTISDSHPGIFPLAIMQMQILKENKLEFKDPHSSIIKNTIENIVTYKHRGDVANSSYIWLQLLSVFGMIREEFLHSKNVNKTQVRMKQGLIDYIHQNIYDPHKCRIKIIALQFNLSSGYFGDYFKKNFGISYRDYINQYRTTLIEKRIAGGQLNMKGIAAEFGFNDESHFSNYFKNQRKSRPTKFRSMSWSGIGENKI